eukprot:gene20904-12127_t
MLNDDEMARLGADACGLPDGRLAEAADSLCACTCEDI